MDLVPRAAIQIEAVERLASTLLGHSASHSERLFLCRVSDTGPLMIYPPVLMAGVRKPSGKEPAGGGVGGLLSMGICRGSVLGRGCTGRRNGRRTDDRGRDFVVMSVWRHVFGDLHRLGSRGVQGQALAQSPPSAI